MPLGRTISPRQQPNGASRIRLLIDDFRIGGFFPTAAGSQSRRGGAMLDAEQLPVDVGHGEVGVTSLPLGARKDPEGDRSLSLSQFSRDPASLQQKNAQAHQVCRLCGRTTERP